MLEAARAKGKVGPNLNQLKPSRAVVARQVTTAAFVFIGASPHTGWLRDFVSSDRHGFLLTGRDVTAVERFDGGWPLLLETSRFGDLLSR